MEVVGCAGDGKSASKLQNNFKQKFLSNVICSFATSVNATGGGSMLLTTHTHSTHTLNRCAENNVLDSSQPI